MTAPDEPDMTDPGDDNNVLAAELALGVLEGDERAAALRRILAEPAFGREVAEWRGRLDALATAVPEVDPGPDLERRVLAGVGPAPAAPAAPWAGWRAATAVSSAAAVLLGLLVLRPPEVVRVPQVVRVPALPAPAPLVAVIAPQAGDAFSAVFDRAAGEVRLTGSIAVPRGRDAELWAIGPDGVPQALGLLTQQSGRRVGVRGVAVAPGTTLAISIEPVGGSPGPTPTGPVVATGKLVIA